MSKKKKTLSLNIFSLISLLLAVVAIVLFCLPFLSVVSAGPTRQTISGFDFLIYPFQKLLKIDSGNALLNKIESYPQTDTLELPAGIFADFSMLFSILYLLLSVLRIAGLINVKRNTLPVMILIGAIFLLATTGCILSAISQLQEFYSFSTLIYLPLISTTLSVIFSLLRR